MNSQTRKGDEAEKVTDLLFPPVIDENKSVTYFPTDPDRRRPFQQL